jgi:hypothetical protein
MYTRGMHAVHIHKITRAIRASENHSSWKVGEQDMRIRYYLMRSIFLVMSATILAQAVVPLVGGKARCTGRTTNSLQIPALWGDRRL